MNDDFVTERKKWFRFFPEGSIEFLLITRVLALLLLAALAVISSPQRPAVLVALAFLLWVDYVLMLWWVIQLATDLDDLFQEVPPNPNVAHRRRTRTALLAVLPSVAAVLLLAPWLDVLNAFHPSSLFRETLPRVMLPVLGSLFIIFVFIAQYALRRIRLGPALWTLLLLVPVVHWFAMHRLLSPLQKRIQERYGERDDASGHPEQGPSISLILADVTWLLSILPWGIVIVLALQDCSWSPVVPLCGTMLASVFAVADLAAMERLQRQFVGLLQGR